MSDATSTQQPSKFDLRELVESIEFARPRKPQASADGKSRIVAEVSIRMPLIGMRFDTGIWAEEEKRGDRTIGIIPKFSLPKKVHACDDDDKPMIEAFKAHVISAFWDWTEELAKGEPAEASAARTVAKPQARALPTGVQL